jgi:hypothetical protein
MPAHVVDGDQFPPASSSPPLPPWPRLANKAEPYGLRTFDGHPCEALLICFADRRATRSIPFDSRAEAVGAIKDGKCTLRIYSDLFDTDLDAVAEALDNRFGPFVLKMCSRGLG